MGITVCGSCGVGFALCVGCMVLELECVGVVVCVSCVVLKLLFVKGVVFGSCGV